MYLHSSILKLKSIFFQCEDKQNGLLITDLIFDNFIGEKVPDRSSTLLRFNMFYNINPTALRKLIIYSEKHLDFEEAYQYITALLKTLYTGVKKKEDRLKNINKENSIPAKRRKSSDESGKKNCSKRQNSKIVSQKS